MTEIGPKATLYTKKFCSSTEPRGGLKIISHRDLLEKIQDDTITVIMDVVVELKSETFRSYTIQPDAEVYRQRFCQRLASVVSGDAAQRTTDFVIRSNDGQDFRVHRCLLMVHSPVFAAMLTHDSEENQDGLCELNDIDGESISILRDYVYGCEMEKINLGNVERVLIMADKYAVEDLRSFCESMLAKNISPENATKYLALAEQRGLETLKMEVQYALNTEHAQVQNAANELLDNISGENVAEEQEKSGWFSWLRYWGS
ncbi:speckle-type POZ protein-like [Paramacrobiotus metropolitanus]|uniref:speckle-type POZ protein-like n=1 Tax=Paramacrobiotus metropolitanus TaxID=2943436 RepID=UPI0024461AD1|nr:speckle-type POZ protein-like [Paramacrobiotus metropolitanus]